uniref:Rho GDP-dissociation inhibitor-like protein n=1 Tax=Medicago truncatula TaxID=3880 RepID=I3T5S4_MEDTR|nr:unknown [Medicago truncatula]
MATTNVDDEWDASTEGYKVGEKKTIDEYKKLDAEDESLARWKQSLGIGAGTSIGERDDERTVVILELSLLVAGRPDVVINFERPGSLKQLQGHRFIIKEGCTYRMKVKFRVQHEVISGLKYVQLVKRFNVRVDKSDEMMGSYPPNTKENPFYEKTFIEEEAPKNVLLRGEYEATSRFVDDDKNVHLEFQWGFAIKNRWD